MTETGGELIGMTVLVLAVYRMTLSQEIPDTGHVEAPTRDSAAVA